MSQDKSSTFMQRLEQYKIRSQDKRAQLQQKAETPADKECTFKPMITTTAKNIPPRSIEDRIKSGLERKRQKTEMLRAMIEQKEMEGVTLRPQLTRSKAYESVQSKLQVKSDPQNYLNRLQTRQQKAQEREEQIRRQMLQKEMQECTFQPKIHDAPAYVKAIASSISLTREVNPSPRPSRPDWR